MIRKPKVETIPHFKKTLNFTGIVGKGFKSVDPFAQRNLNMDAELTIEEFHQRLTEKRKNADSSI